jgi:hypothetical protein
MNKFTLSVISLCVFCVFTINAQNSRITSGDITVRLNLPTYQHFVSYNFNTNDSISMAGQDRNLFASYPTLRTSVPLKRSATPISIDGTLFPRQWEGSGSFNGTNYQVLSVWESSDVLLTFDVETINFPIFFRYSSNQELTRNTPFSVIGKLRLRGLNPQTNQIDILEKNVEGHGIATVTINYDITSFPRKVISKIQFNFTD